MHELSLLQSMLGIITAAAQEQGFAHVLRVRLEVGALSCAQEDALRFGFDLVARDTVAEGALLELVTVHGAAWCWDCETVVPLSSLGDPCPACGHHRLQIRGGDKLRVLDLEVT